MRNVIYIFFLVLAGLLSTAQADFIPIENASFELPVVDPNAFQALPYIDSWNEIDLDTEASANTGVFPNTDPNSYDNIINAHGNQMVFLGSQQGNAIEQDLDNVYKAGCDYKLTVAVGISSLFPPAQSEPIDTIELALYYRDANEPNEAKDIVTQTVNAADMFSIQLQDFSLYLSTVPTDANWADNTIGIAIRSTGMAGGFWILDDIRLEESLPISIHIVNASFELPVVDPNAFQALPYIDGWIELDLDPIDSSNTGVFPNTDPNSYDNIINAHGNQMVFLGSQQGNAIAQDLDAAYKAGCDYRLTAAVGISSLFPPAQAEPIDTIELALYYRDANDPNETIDIVTQTVEAADMLMTQLQDYSLYLPAVPSNANWTDMKIGIAIRSTGMAGGFWVLENVRLIESLPLSIPIENASFEFPVIDPLNAYGAGPIVDDWIELDVDPEGLSRNTGVFANTELNSFDHIINADGSQLAFLFTEMGNALEQDLAAVYKEDCIYRLSVAVGVSSRIPPTILDPVGTLELALYYLDVNEPGQTIDIVSRTIEATGLIPTQLEEFSLYLPAIYPDSEWAGQTIGVAVRATGIAGGVWVLDNVRLGESLPVQNAALMSKE